MNVLPLGGEVAGRTELPAGKGAGSIGAAVRPKLQVSFRQRPPRPGVEKFGIAAIASQPRGVTR